LTRDPREPPLRSLAQLAHSIMTAYVSELIQKGRVDEIKEVMSKGDEVGMHTFDQSLFNLYAAKRISLKDALRFADSHTDLALRVRLSDHQPTTAAAPLTVNETQGAPPHTHTF
jgi:twitching motility protein PilU